MRKISIDQLRTAAREQGFDVERSSIKGHYRLLDARRAYAVNPDTHRPIFSVDAAFRYLARRKGAQSNELA